MKIFFITLIIVLTVIIINVVLTRRRIHTGVALARSTKAFEQELVGTALLLPWGTRWLFERRTRAVRNIFIEAAGHYGAQYIDLFREHAKDPFYKNPRYYYAADLFHPSSAGYADWYAIMQPTLSQFGGRKIPL